ncbi:MAG: hypothetical protein JW953_01585 [Anaerolineae bacterium]|nr:hypothetical protein [Anaerolineae bacterium]
MDEFIMRTHEIREEINELVIEVEKTVDELPANDAGVQRLSNLMVYLNECKRSLTIAENGLK